MFGLTTVHDNQFLAVECLSRCKRCQAVVDEDA